MIPLDEARAHVLERVAPLAPVRATSRSGMEKLSETSRSFRKSAFSTYGST